MQHRCDSSQGQCAVCASTFHSAPQPNWRFNADANTGHAFGIFMASAGALRLRLRRRLTSALDHMALLDLHIRICEEYKATLMGMCS